MYYTASHEWVDVKGEIATIGITDHAQKELGDIVYVELPSLGHQVEAGQEVVVVESTKAAIDLYSPLSGEIVEINTALREYPEKVNTAPESEGWLVRLKLAEPKELSSLLDKAAYERLIQS